MKSSARTVNATDDNKFFFILIDGKVIFIPIEVSKFKKGERVSVRKWAGFYEVKSLDSMYSEMSWSLKKK